MAVSSSVGGTSPEASDAILTELRCLTVPFLAQIFQILMQVAVRGRVPARDGLHRADGSVRAGMLLLFPAGGGRTLRGPRATFKSDFAKDIYALILFV